MEGVYVNWYREMEPESVIVLAELDSSEPYEVDQTAVTFDTQTGKFSVLFASGCSCWDGDADMWTFDSLDEVEKFLNDEALDAETYKCSLKGGIEMMAEAKEAFAKFQSAMG